MTDTLLKPPTDYDAIFVVYPDDNPHVTDLSEYYDYIIHDDEDTFRVIYVEQQKNSKEIWLYTVETDESEAPKNKTIH